MAHYVTLCQSDVAAQALEVWRELLGEKRLQAIDQVAKPIIFDPRLCFQENGSVAYQILVDRIESSVDLDRNSLGENGVVVIVDSVRPSGLSAISDGGTWDHLIAMLILTFPEIRWVFGVVQEKSEGFPAEDHQLLTLLTRPRRESLLDPTGLREWVKSRTTAALRVKGQDHQEFELPKRCERAAAIDEETEYAFAHGYTAYRYGFRTDVITSWDLMQNLFGRSALERGGHGYSLILEDVRLNFPDKPAKVHLSRLSVRGELCPCLGGTSDDSKWRFLVTTGQMGDDKKLMSENEEFLKARKTSKRGDILYKPVGGIVDLWSKAGLTESLSGGVRPGNAEGFIWPPALHQEGPTDGHGSPGSLSQVASTLLRRARDIRRNADTVTKFIRGAVLATDATELLGGKTPTLTLSGLALKHEFEVKAECAFVGAGYHFGVTQRLKELDLEVSAVTRWFHAKNQKRSSWDAKASIVNLLTLVFREAGRMEEEHECLVALRRINRKISRPRNLDPLAWFAHISLAYGEWLLGSFSLFSLLAASWVVVLVGIAWWLGSRGVETPIESTSKVVNWFFGGSAESGELWPIMLLSWVGVLAGVFHLGILISYLYSLIARK